MCITPKSFLFILISCPFLYYHPPPCHHKALICWFSVYVSLYFLELYINGIIEYIIFFAWLLLLSLSPWRFVHVIMCIASSLFFLIFIWLPRVLVVACGIFNYVMWTLRCCIWDLIPWPGMEPRPPALGAWSLSPWTTGEVPIALSLLLSSMPWQECTTVNPFAHWRT